MIARTRALTAGRGVGLVLDHVCGPEFAEYLGVLDKWGTLVSYNAFAGLPEQNLMAEMRNYLDVCPAVRCFSFHIYDHDREGRRAIMREVIDALAKGEIRPAISATLKLSEVRKASTRCWSPGAALGKIYHSALTARHTAAKRHTESNRCLGRSACDMRPLPLPDPSRLADYYASVIGLGVDRARGRLHLPRQRIRADVDRDRRAGEAALASGSRFEVAGRRRPRRDARRAGSGRHCRRDPQRDPLPGISSVKLACADREGTEFELVSGWSPSPAQERIAGLAVTKLGHVALGTRDPLAASTFCTEVMGFRVSDWIEDRFVFLRCGYEHHTLNFAKGPERRLHHIAFELRDAAHMHRACDLLARHDASGVVGSGAARPGTQRRHLPPRP